jgi:hypothetical protein
MVPLVAAAVMRRRGRRFRTCRGSRDDGCVALLLVRGSRAVGEHGESRGEREREDHYEALDRPEAEKRCIARRRMDAPLMEGGGTAVHRFDLSTPLLRRR